MKKVLKKYFYLIGISALLVFVAFIDSDSNEAVKKQEVKKNENIDSLTRLLYLKGSLDIFKKRTKDIVLTKKDLEYYINEKEKLFTIINENKKNLEFNQTIKDQLNISLVQLKKVNLRYEELITLIYSNKLKKAINLVKLETAQDLLIKVMKEDAGFISKVLIEKIPLNEKLFKKKNKRGYLRFSSPIILSSKMKDKENILELLLDQKFDLTSFVSAKYLLSLLKNYEKQRLINKMDLKKAQNIFNFLDQNAKFSGKYSLLKEAKKSLEKIKKLKKDFGKVIIKTNIEGLNIIIDEKLIGKTVKNKEFIYTLKSEDGTATQGSHEITLKKSINEKEEYSFYDKFYFDKYYNENRNYIKTYHLNKNDIRKQFTTEQTAVNSGLIKKIKLQHHNTWSMAVYENELYIITRAINAGYSIKDREKEEGYFLEVYNLSTYELKHHIKLKTTSYTFYHGLEVDKENIYIATNNKEALIYDRRNPTNEVKGSLKGKIKYINNYAKKLYSHHDRVEDVEKYKNYIFTMGEYGRVLVYKNKKFIYQIDIKDNLPNNFKELKEHNGVYRINDILVHKNILYLATLDGFINTYSLKNGKFLNQINSIYYEKEYLQYVGRDITSLQMYKNKYLIFSSWHSGIYIYDIQKKEFTQKRKKLFPKKSSYSKLFKKTFDNTKVTDIYKFVIYKDNLIFTEATNKIYIYNLKKEKIIHKFEGIEDSITSLIIKNNRLISLSSNGNTYLWNLKVIDNK